MRYVAPETMTPYATRPDQRTDTTRMWFSDEDAKYNGEYHLYGGVCWPKATQHAGGPAVMGHVVLMAQNVKTGHHYLFDETSFVTIDHVYKGDEFKHRGVAQWFVDVDRKFGPLVSYWWGDQPDNVFIRNYRLLRESVLIGDGVRLAFGRAMFAQEVDPMQVLYERIERGVIHAPKTSAASLASKEHAARLGQDPVPALHALLCAVAGNEQYPWQRPKDKPLPVEMLVHLR